MGQAGWEVGEGGGDGRGGDGAGPGWDLRAHYTGNQKRMRLPGFLSRLHPEGTSEDSRVCPMWLSYLERTANVRYCSQDSLPPASQAQAQSDEPGHRRDGCFYSDKVHLCFKLCQRVASLNLNQVLDDCVTKVRLLLLCLANCSLRNRSETYNCLSVVL